MNEEIEKQIREILNSACHEVLSRSSEYWTGVESECPEYIDEILALITTTRREAVEGFAKGLKKSFRTRIEVLPKRSERGELSDLNETYAVNHVLTKCVPQVIQKCLVEFRQENKQ